MRALNLRLQEGGEGETRVAAAALAGSSVVTKVQIGSHLAHGKGTGGDAGVGRRSAERMGLRLVQDRDGLLASLARALEEARQTVCSC